MQIEDYVLSYFVVAIFLAIYLHLRSLDQVNMLTGVCAQLQTKLRIIENTLMCESDDDDADADADADDEQDSQSTCSLSDHEHDHDIKSNDDEFMQVIRNHHQFYAKKQETMRVLSNLFKLPSNKFVLSHVANYDSVLRQIHKHSKVPTAFHQMFKCAANNYRVVMDNPQLHQSLVTRLEDILENGQPRDSEWAQHHLDFYKEFKPNQV